MQHPALGILGLTMRQLEKVSGTNYRTAVKLFSRKRRTKGMSTSSVDIILSTLEDQYNKREREFTGYERKLVRDWLDSLKQSVVTTGARK